MYLVYKIKFNGMKKTIILSALLVSVLADDDGVSSVVPIAIVAAVCCVIGGLFVLWFVNCIMKRREEQRQMEAIKAKLRRKVHPEPFPIPMDQPTIEEFKHTTDPEPCIICLEPVLKKDIVLKPCGHWQFH
jgi:hypothetical protein